MTSWVEAAVLYVHLISAALFVGGSFFMWLVLEPVSHRLGLDEAARTRLVGQTARRFGQMVIPLLAILVGTGLYNASWYLPRGSVVGVSLPGELLVAKSVTVVVLIALIYVHGLYYGKRIVRMAREGDVEGLRALRRRSRVVAYANLGLMLVVLAFAVALQAVA